MKTTNRLAYIISILSLVGGSLFVSPLHAQEMNYQGRLTDDQGDPLADGQYELTFSLHDAASGGGNQVWGPYIADGSNGDGHGPLAEVINGRFNVVIGPLDTSSVPLADSFSGGDRYLELKVEANAPIAPRQRMLHAPMAMNAVNADRTTVADSAGAGTAPFGIGVSSAAAALHVVSGGASGASLGGDSVTAIFDRNSDNTVLINAANDTASQILFQRPDAAKTGLIRYSDSSAGGMLISTPGGDILLDQDGEFGIGVTNPAAPLHVLKDGASGASLGGDSVTAIFDRNSDNSVLINAANDTVSQILFQRPDAAKTGLIRYSDSPAGGMLISTPGGDILLDQDGELGIGTATPTEKLDVVGNIKASGTVTAAGRITGNGGIYASLPDIGDKGNMQYNIATGEIGYDNSSRRFKQNIQSLAADFDKLLDLDPKTYTRAKSPDFWEIGFIAEDVNDLGLKELVRFEDDGETPRDINYRKMVVYLTKIATGQRDEITALEAKFEELEARDKIRDEKLMLIESLLQSRKKASAE